jgi:hypothetical protein
MAGREALSGPFPFSRSADLNRMRFLRPDSGCINLSWKMTGDKNYDGTDRPARRRG